MPVRPVIALMTDFGTTDHYVGTMKGVLAGICPDALTIDLTHEVPPQDIAGAAWRLAAAWRYFPADTIFLVVVDPGVGTHRDAVVVRVDGAWLVGPDNGVFDGVLAESPAIEARRLENPQFMRPAVSATFEGRDRFAPAAGWLARGTPVEAFGPPASLSPRLPFPQPEDDGRGLVGHILHVDHFGNLTTDLPRSRLGARITRADIRVAGQGPLPFVRTYGDAAPGTLVALFGSTDSLEVAVVGGSAASRLGAGRGLAVRVAWRA